MTSIVGEGLQAPGGARTNTCAARMHIGYCQKRALHVD